MCYALCRIGDYVAFGIVSHSRLCCSALCRSALCPSGLCSIRGYVVRHNVAFGIMSHSALCHIRTYVVWDCVVRRNVVRHNVAGCNVIWSTVGVSFSMRQCYGVMLFYPMRHMSQPPALLHGSQSMPLLVVNHPLPHPSPPR